MSDPHSRAGRLTLKSLVAKIQPACSVVTLAPVSGSKDGISGNGAGNCARYSAPERGKQGTSATFIPARDGAIGQANEQAHKSGQDGTDNKQAAVHERSSHFISQNRMVFASDRSE